MSEFTPHTEIQLNDPRQIAMMLIEEAAPVLLVPERRNDVSGFMKNAVEPVFQLEKAYENGISSRQFETILEQLETPAKGIELYDTATDEPVQYISENTFAGVNDRSNTLYARERAAGNDTTVIRHGSIGPTGETYAMYVLHNGEPTFVSIWEPDKNNGNIFSGREVGTWRRETDTTPSLHEGFSSAEQAFGYLREFAGLPKGRTWQNMHIPQTIVTNPAS